MAKDLLVFYGRTLHVYGNYIQRYHEGINILNQLPKKLVKQFVT